jgi:hypothetical protein
MDMEIHRFDILLEKIMFEVMTGKIDDPAVHAGHIVVIAEAIGVM